MPIICRYDMVEVFVKITPKNLRHFHDSGRQLLQDIYCDLMSNEPSKRYRQGRWDRQDFTNKDERIIIKWPALPLYNNDLLRIRIVNSNKWDWRLHHGYIRSVGDLLDIHEIDYAISKLEIAFDMRDPNLRDLFASNVWLKWGRPTALFNYQKGKHRRYGSTDGIDEYLFKRSSPRQTHSYLREYRIRNFDSTSGEADFYRWELRLKRRYLRTKGLETIDDAFDQTRNLIENSLAFCQLDRKSLNRDIRRAKDWRLKGKSVAEQKRMLKKNGLNPGQIKKYFIAISPPPIYFAVADINSDFGQHLEYELLNEQIFQTAALLRGE